MREVSEQRFGKATVPGAHSSHAEALPPIELEPAAHSLQVIPSTKLPAGHSRTSISSQLCTTAAFSLLFTHVHTASKSELPVLGTEVGM